MIRAALAALAVLAACSDDDPCAGATTCLRIDVDSATVDTIDLLELDVLYGDHHATTTTRAAGHPTSLPLATALVLDLPDSEAIPVGVVAAGKLGGMVLGTGAASATVAPGHHASVDIELGPVDDCQPGAHYCGGDRLAGDPRTLYECNGGGVPIARGICAYDCIVHQGQDDVCRGGGGTCRDGALYCGGDKLDGDPGTLYICMAGVGTQPRTCASACVVRPGDDDICR